ncbi:protein LONG AFTER FAR-RED 3 isoform X1 [Vigna angularis]|uniref:protein LONG AFTER FAR-RED 3 isoform X1 n=1 Tax=Phaseolus angularis TaxID=3914 RepID=UPI0022B4550D|nr:protein LONG AFTER FAR-RED 3 isoform X1 [Vigna angularis]
MDFLLIHLFLFVPILFFFTFLSLPFPFPTYFWAWKSQLSHPVADLVLRNGVIYTSDDSLPFAESMAVANGRVLRVGNHSFVKELEGYGTQVLDLGGKVVVPGFIDSHVHFIPGGLQMMQVELRGVSKKEEFVRRIKDAAQSSKQGSWILGGGWNNDLWKGDLPAASWIDDITPNNPVWLSRVDGHMGLANSVALKLAGITNVTDDPMGGIIVRAANGVAVIAEFQFQMTTTRFCSSRLGDHRDIKIAAIVGQMCPHASVTGLLSVFLPATRGGACVVLPVSLTWTGVLDSGATNHIIEPTGVLIDLAGTLITSLIPEDSVDDRREALLRASSLALTRGVTTVVDMGRYYPGFSPELSWDDFSDVYQWANSMSKMKIRVCLFFSMETRLRLVDLINKVGHTLSEWIYIGGVKAFADGSLGSNSALLYEPYVDEPDNYGLQVTEPEGLLNMTLESDLYGLQVAIHAIGDKTNDLILDLYRSVASANGMRDRRFRIEHAQQLAAGTPGRFGKQRVVASMQPDQLLDDADSTSKKLGKDRADTESYLFRSLLNNNALVAFGSDWPVVDINPLSGIKTAMKRKPPTWKSAWIPSECISLDDAIKAYTISAAHASFLDKDLGSLSPGKLADFVILSTDSWQDFAEDASASIEQTYVSGVRAYP